MLCGTQWISFPSPLAVSFAWWQSAIMRRRRKFFVIKTRRVSRGWNNVENYTKADEVSLNSFKFSFFLFQWTDDRHFQWVYETAKKKIQKQGWKFSWRWKIFYIITCDILISRLLWKLERTFLLRRWRSRIWELHFKHLQLSPRCQSVSVKLEARTMQKIS